MAASILQPTVDSQRSAENQTPTLQAKTSNELWDRLPGARRRADASQRRAARLTLRHTRLSRVARGSRHL